MYQEDRIYNHSVERKDGEKHYFISFIDTFGSSVKMEVSAEVYKVSCKAQRIEARIARSDRRHIAYSEISELNLNMKLLNNDNPSVLPCTDSSSFSPPQVFKLY